MYTHMRILKYVPFLALFLFISCISEEQRLDNVFEDYWEYQLQTNPLFATAQGDHRFNDRLPDSDLNSVTSRNSQLIEFLIRLDHVDYGGLDDESRLNYEIFRLQLEQANIAYDLNDHLLPLNGWWDYHATFADLGNRVPLSNTEDYENYLARLSAFPDYNSGYIERMEKGIEEGVVRPQIVFDDYLASVEAHITDDPEETNWFEPFDDFPSSVSDEDRERLRDDARQVLSETVIPEFQRLYDFLRDDYIPASAESIAISDIEGGDEYYQYLVESYTTMEITPEEVHETGLDEVSRIRSEDDADCGRDRLW
jgi:uncharacterized protein (DUF885 family)